MYPPCQFYSKYYDDVEMSTFIDEVSRTTAAVKKTPKMPVELYCIK